MARALITWTISSLICMRSIEYATKFKRDYKRVAKGMRKSVLDDLLKPVVFALAKDVPLEPHHRDHELTCNWKGYRDCHLKPDLVLIYRKSGDNLLSLVRLGSHSNLFQ